MNVARESRRIVALCVSVSLHLAMASTIVWLGPAARHGRGEPRIADAVTDLPGRSLPSAASQRASTGLRPGTQAPVPSLASLREEGSRTRSSAGGLLDHLWQSTIFAFGAALLTVAFRRNGANVRSWLWFGGSVKFLVPFSVAPPLGAILGSPPMPPSAFLAVWALGLAALIRIRLRMWRSIRAAVRASTPLELHGIPVPPGVEIRSAPGVLEPGVVGWRRPILLMPIDIQHHLSVPQLSMIVTHELCHIRRRDNLTAAIHMVVESIFWFHPLVWWIGARLVDERERACDEHVLRARGERHVYAQAIVSVCRRSAESPPVYVSGVGGSSIRKRIDAILHGEVGEALGTVKKAILCMAVIAGVVIPGGLGLLNVTRLNAQGPPQSSDFTVDAATRNAVIDASLEVLNASYVFPDVAKKMESAIRARQARKEYDAITSGRRFAQILTEHLREVSRDLHLSVDAIPQGPPPPPPGGAGVPSSGVVQTLAERQRAIAGRGNFGFFRVERLAGNIGYVDVRGFISPALAGDTATAAMTFLAQTDAVIFDLRQNGGGDPNMVAFLSSYLLGPQAVHLNDFYSRPTNETRQSWTLPFVPGARLVDVDVYILTSSRTFSGAEEFTYNLKHLKRATVVGETTGGAAHTVAGRRLGDRFVIAVPTGRPINAVTKSNWEGVGVEPDVSVPAEHALSAAHLMALERQQRRLTADTPGLRNEVATTIPTLRKELGPLAASIPTSDDSRPLPASRASDDFESGTLDGWRVDQRGSGGWFAYSSGKVSPDPARTDLAFPFDVPAPPQGKFAAVTDQNAPGRFILYRDVTLDGRYRLHLSVFYVNFGRFSRAPTSNRHTINDEQQYRIDIVAPSAPVDSVATEHVLATIFQAKPDDPARLLPTEVTFDLSPWEGQTVRLRLSVGENQAPLRAGVDDVRFERISP